jgi:murein DD-endopeptidase MepM/ murein hydrolase activator NlpD
MKRVFALGGMLLLLVLLPTVLPLRMEAPPLPRPATPLTFKVLEGTIARNSTLAAVLSAALTPAKIHHLVEAARPVYDLARVSAGHPFGLTLGADGLIAAFTYGIDELRTLRVVRRGPELEAELLERQYEVRVERAAGLIDSSLFEAVTASGEGDQLALDLAEIFAWDVDFNTEIQRGDAFRVAVQKFYLDGRFSRYGTIQSAEFTRGERVLRALRFEAEHGPGYYTPDGTPLRKAFLRSPLRFSRISSRFSRARLHPILKTVRPHLGVDYAAPLGTPVSAAADGVVSMAGWHGGYGRAVRIRHANGFETLYGHLSRISVRPGQRVAQGTPIGAVGSTGLSTAPHLDYRMTRDGVFVNPLTIQSPPAEPIAPGERVAFERERDSLLGLLEDKPPAAAERVEAVLPGS